MREILPDIENGKMIINWNNKTIIKKCLIASYLLSKNNRNVMTSVIITVPIVERLII